MTRFASLVLVFAAATDVSAQHGGGGVHFTPASPVVHSYTAPTVISGAAHNALPLVARASRFRGAAFSGYGFGGYGLGYYPFSYGYPYGYSLGYYAYPSGGYTWNSNLDADSYFILPQQYYQPRNFAALDPLPNDHPSSARLTLQVPAGAEVALNGRKIEVIGRRIFESPDLKPDERFTFEVVVTWPGNGKAVEEKRTLSMQAGDHQSLQYLAAPSLPTRGERIERLEK